MVGIRIADEDKANNSKQSAPIIPSLKYANTSFIQFAVVRVSFRSDSNGAWKDGNGFFVHIPGCDADVILTAGHNLCHSPRAFYTDILVTFAESTASGTAKETTVSVTGKSVFVCQEYADNPTLNVGDPGAEHDYGAIILARVQGSSAPRRPAFGWSAILGEARRIVGDMSITGYQSGVGGGAASTSTGPCATAQVRENQFEYRAAAEAGISGAPVWMGYEGIVTAVAVHNYGAPRGRVYNRGSRINHKLLRDVFRWTKVGKAGKRLGAHSLVAPQHPLGLFFPYSEPDGIFRAVVAEDEYDPSAMELDLWPVYAPPLLAPSTEETGQFPLYAFQSKGR
ncbi:hypothetical protein F5Y17DRAFT_433499 [Xylariaceae sp. FL0594]|nr:hypothetical protein F5Y17DRAFT_433499 [Xylariaceae sp. FL0594]